MKKYYIYKTTNLLNGKYYIGMHISNDKQHFETYLGSGKYLNRAVKKYGRKNFKKEILQYAQNEIDLIQLQKKYVNEIIVQDNNSYNLNIGGASWYYVNKYHYSDGVLKKKLNSDPLFRQKYCKTVSEALKKYYQTHPSTFKGKKHKDTSKLKIAENHYDCSGSNNSQYGTKWYANKQLNKNLKIKLGDDIPQGYIPGMIKPDVTKETCLKISNSKKGKKLSEYTKQRMRGKIPWNKGKKMKDIVLNFVPSNKGKICINMNGINKFIQSQYLQQYIKMGWIRGILNNRNWKNPQAVKQKFKKTIEEKRRLK